MKIRILSALLSGLVLSGSAVAATETANLNVSATVAGACAITAAPTTLAFGNYYPSFSGNVDLDTTFDVTCATAAPYSIGLGNGQGSGASANTRYMNETTPNTPLAYGLYFSAANRTAGTGWGASVSPTVAGAGIAAVGTGAAVTYTIYGRVFGGQTAVAAGSYSDTVVVTVTF